MNSFMSWVGGKKALREEVVRRFPLYYERYIEVFGGGGWVLFHKNPGMWKQYRKKCRVIRMKLSRNWWQRDIDRV